MTHNAKHTQFGEGAGGTMLDITCPECQERVVGNLDDNNFRVLMGMTREEFEDFCQDNQNSDDGTGLYNFFEAIMGANALKVAFRKEELQHRMSRKRAAEV